MHKIINNPLNLSSQEMEYFSSIFYTNQYEIGTSIPTEKNIPDLLSTTLREKSNYQLILDDPSAYFYYFSAKYLTKDKEVFDIPMGAFGISDKRKIRFPLVINGLWQILLKLDKRTFCEGCEIIGDGDCNKYFLRLIEWKKKLIQKIFSYYYSLDGGYCSAMAWPSKGEKSNTRIIAESLSFQRICFNDQELYSTSKINPDSDLLRYFKNCMFRWDIIDSEESKELENINAGPKLRQLVESIIKCPDRTENIIA